MDFDQIASAVNSRSTDITKILEKSKVQYNDNIPPVMAFEERYSIKYNSPVAILPEASNDSSSAPPTISDLSNTFKVLDRIPTCFPKLQRKHSAQLGGKKGSSKQNDSLSASSSIASNVSALAASTTKLIVDDVALTSERLFHDRSECTEKFESMIKTATTEVQDVQHQFGDGVQDLRRALNDLVKLVPRGLDASKDVFAASDELAIGHFREEIDALFCMQENKDLYRVVEMPDDGDLDVISKLAGELLGM